MRELTAAQLTAFGRKKWATYPSDVLPAWIADMDFDVAPAITTRIHQELERGYHLYPTGDLEAEFIDRFIGRAGTHWGWSGLTANGAMVVTDLVQALVACVLAYSAPGDYVGVLTPIYPPFLDSVNSTGRRVLSLPLREGQDRYEIDFAAMEAQLAANSVPVLLLCSPHNPTGRVFDREELNQLAAICARTGTLIVTDEIHSDLVYRPHEFTALGELAAEHGVEYVCLQAPTKTFNIAGVRCAVIYFGSADIRARFESQHPARLLGKVSSVGLTAACAAWSADSNPWLAQVLDVLTKNRRTVQDWARVHASQVSAFTPEGTYFFWLNLHRMESNAESGSAYQQLLADGRIALNPGPSFQGTERHVRLNFATSPEILEEALTRISRSL